MDTAEQLEGVAGTLLRMIDNPGRLDGLQWQLDRYCHRLRNRLNSLKLSLYLARRLDQAAPVAWEDADANYRRMEVLIEHLQAVVTPLRLAPIEIDLLAWLAEAMPCWRRALEAGGLSMAGEGPDGPLPVRFDTTRFSQAIAPLIEAWARPGAEGSTVRLRWGADGECCALEFAADGPVGPRLVGALGAADGLALPRLARVLQAHGGRLDIRDGRAPSLRLRWPAEPPRA